MPDITYEIFDGGIDTRTKTGFCVNCGESRGFGVTEAMLLDRQLPENYEQFKNVIYLFSTSSDAGVWGGGLPR